MRIILGAVIFKAKTRTVSQQKNVKGAAAATDDDETQFFCVTAFHADPSSQLIPIPYHGTGIFTCMNGWFLMVTCGKCR